MFLTHFLKDCTKKVLKSHKSIVIENFKPVLLCPIKCRPFNLNFVAFTGEILKGKLYFLCSVVYL